jgi:hypothetical protein
MQIIFPSLGVNKREVGHDRGPEVVVVVVKKKTKRLRDKGRTLQRIGLRKCHKYSLRHPFT